MMVLHEVNALLRQLFTGFTIVYDDGHLVFHWRHGGGNGRNADRERPR